MNRVMWAERGNDVAVADHVAAAVNRGGTSFAISGGKTVTSILTLLAARDLPWAGVEIVPTDERRVPAEHPDSNFGALTRAFAPTSARVLPMSPGMAVAPFDLVWLGMGLDGHIASLFPGTAMGANDRPAVVEVSPDPLPPEAPFDRYSFNMAALLATPDLMLVIRGQEKRALLEAAIGGDSDLPIAQLIRTAHQPVQVFWSEA